MDGRPGLMYPIPMFLSLSLVACVSASLPPMSIGGTADGTEQVPAATAPILVINEVMARNASTLQDGDGVFPDWVEIWNADQEEVPLRSVVLENEEDEPWRGGSGSLLPGERLLLLADGTDAEGHAPFTLDRDGDRLRLFVDGVETDRVSTGVMPVDVALARVPDGGAWHPTIEPTPGWYNTAAGMDQTDARDSVFQDYHVLMVEFFLSDEAYDTLAYSRGVEVDASMTIDGAWYPTVRLALKGSGSYQPLSGKSAFKVDLNDVDPDAKFRGLDHLTFNNGVTWDPTWTHEYMTYSVFRELGIPAPRVGWAWIRLNGEDYGLYMNVETWDPELLEVWFQDPEGDLWEGQGDFLNGNVESSFHHEAGPEDWGPLGEVQAVLETQANEENLARLGRLVDLDEFLPYMAGESVTLHWDGYESPNNWRIYFDPVRQRFWWLPTGVDYTWSWAMADAWYGHGDVFVWCLKVPSCLDRFNESLVDVAQTTIDMNLETLFRDLSDWLDPYIQADPRTPHSDRSIESARQGTVMLIETWPPDVIRQVEER